MSAFIRLWTILSALCSIILCYLIPVIIKRKLPMGEELIFLITLAIAYWISLGLIQSQLLKSYIQNAYLWGLITIIGGIAGSFLVAIGLMSASAIVIMRAIAMNDFSELEIVILFSLIIVSLFGSGFLLGWLQKLVLRRSRIYNKFNYLPWITGLIWLISLPAIGITWLFTFGGYFLPYGFTIIFCAFLSNLIKGAIIKQILIEGSNIN